MHQHNPESPYMARSAHHKSQPMSIHMQKLQLREVETNIQALTNRLNLLKKHEEKQKTRVMHNKERTKQLIKKKLITSDILKLKERDNTQDVQKVEMLKKKNQDIRESHHKQIQQIMQACYLVKLDEARELKNLSIAHERKISELRGQSYEQKKKRKLRVKESEEISKQRYKQYWIEKLTNLYSNRERLGEEIMMTKEEKVKQLKELEEQEIKMMEKINKIQELNSETKKQYVTALSIPVKQVAEMMGTDNDNNSSIKSVAVKQASEQKLTTIKLPTKIPKTNLNEVKLRLILNQLKKNDSKQS